MLLLSVTQKGALETWGWHSVLAVLIFPKTKLQSTEVREFRAGLACPFLNASLGGKLRNLSAEASCRADHGVVLWERWWIYLVLDGSGIRWKALQQVFLTDELSYLTCWQATFLDPQLRLEYEGFPVPGFSSSWRRQELLGNSYRKSWWWGW